MSLNYPTEGRTYVLNVALRGATQYPNWYVVLYEGSYTPQEDDTAANIGGRATEITAYTESARPALVLPDAVAGSTSNSASLAQFTLSAAKTVTAFAVVSSAGKGATSGVLLAIQKLATPRAYSAGDVIKVPVELTLTNPA